jgi:hypothetical protein
MATILTEAVGQEQVVVVRWRIDFLAGFGSERRAAQMAVDQEQRGHEGRLVGEDHFGRRFEGKERLSSDIDRMGTSTRRRPALGHGEQHPAMHENSKARSRRSEVLAVLLIGPAIGLAISLLFQRWGDPNWALFVGVCLIGWLVGTIVGGLYWLKISR